MKKSDFDAEKTDVYLITCESIIEHGNCDHQSIFCHTCPFQGKVDLCQTSLVENSKKFIKLFEENKGGSMRTTEQLTKEVQTELLTEIEEQAKDVIESFLSTVKAYERELEKVQKNLAKAQNDYNELLLLSPEEIVDKHG